MHLNWYMNCNENPIYIFLFWELHGLSPNFHTHVSVSDLFIPKISPHKSCSRIGRSIVGIHKSLTDTWMWKLGLWPHISFVFKFLILVLCRVCECYYTFYALYKERNNRARSGTYKNLCETSLSWGRILWRNPDKSLKSFPPCYSLSTLQICPVISVSSNSCNLLRISSNSRNLLHISTVKLQYCTHKG